MDCDYDQVKVNLSRLDSLSIAKIRKTREKARLENMRVKEEYSILDLTNPGKYTLWEGSKEELTQAIDKVNKDLVDIEAMAGRIYDRTEALQRKISSETM